MNRSVKLKIALVHDWLLEIGGAERVLKAFHELYPQAPIYVLFHQPEFTRTFLPTAELRTSRWQETYELLNGHKLLTPFLPLAVESLDLSEFDLVISTAQFTKGLILKPKTLHINYCSSPTRQIWDWHVEYRDEKYRMSKLPTLLFQHFLRIWDRHASTRVDHYIANSENTRQRIKKYYGREATVIYPPVDQPAMSGEISRFDNQDYFLIVSRLFPHKNIQLAIRAFNKLGWPLVVIGDGPELKRLQRLANQSADIVSDQSADIVFHDNANVKLLGYQSDEVVHQYYANCLAFIMPQEEDFGITPLEAMSYGKPVLALQRGGALEYIEAGVNGEWFEDPREEMLADGARRLKENLANYDPVEIKRTARRFNKERFLEAVSALVHQS